MKVGILGGGQLARMLALEAPRLDLDVHVICSHLDDPAAQVCPHSRVGKLDSVSDLRSFFEGLQAVTVESEFINTKLVELARNKVVFHPATGLLETLQDRLTQKQLLEQYGIPTATFTEWNAETNLTDLHERFPAGFVLKKRRFGYDGYGTFVFKQGESGVVKSDPYGYIAEAFIPFRRELAFSIARNESGDFSIFPLVETKQVNSRCLWVKGPIKHSGIKALTNKFKKLMEEEGYCGILAIELFESRGKLIVNELAPRVHNSAHYSMDALNMSQFEAHWRAILNWPLKNPELLCKGFAMVNLLGENPKHELRLSREPMGKLHWYGKKENRAGRKMGHVNCIGATADEALRTALKWRKDFDL